jgi:hypothetical protein
VVQMWRDARTVGDRHHHGRHHHKCDHPEWTEGQREDAARAGVG